MIYFKFVKYFIPENSGLPANHQCLPSIDSFLTPPTELPSTDYTTLTVLPSVSPDVTPSVSIQYYINCPPVSYVYRDHSIDGSNAWSSTIGCDHSLTMSSGDSDSSPSSMTPPSSGTNSNLELFTDCDSSPASSEYTLVAVVPTSDCDSPLTFSLSPPMSDTPSGGSDDITSPGGFGYSEDTCQLHSQKPQAQLNKPKAQSRSSKAQSRSSKAQYRSSKAQSRSSKSQSKKPESQSKKPESQHKNPESQHKKPESQHKKPESQPKKPESHHKKPKTQPKMPESQPKKPVSQPKKPEYQPKKPVSQARRLKSQCKKSRKQTMIYSDFQERYLQCIFGVKHYISLADRDNLAELLRLPPKDVTVRFQLLPFNIVCI